MSLNIIVKLSAFHPAIVNEITKLSADAELVLAAVNDKIGSAVVIDNDSSVKVSTRATKARDYTVVRSRDSRKAEIEGISEAARLAEIHEMLAPFAKKYTVVKEIELPLSIVRWLGADRFKVSAPVETVSA